MFIQPADLHNQFYSILKKKKKIGAGFGIIVGVTIVLADYLIANKPVLVVRFSSVC